jgi:hypothetical protein
LGLLQGATEYPYTIGQQLAISGIGDISLDYGPIRTQLAPASDLEFRGKRCDTLIESVQRLWFDVQCEAVKRRVIGHSVEVHSAEPTLHCQHTQTDFDRCRIATSFQCVGVPLSQVVLDQLEKFIVLKNSRSEQVLAPSR